MTTTRETATDSGLVRFTARGLPLLSDGTITAPLAVGDSMWVHAKVYSEGGENTLHEHPSEDHSFVVLQGKVTFVDANDEETVLEQFDGMFIPRGTLYRFESSVGENLVMLRVGSGQRAPGDHNNEYPGPMMDRRDESGDHQAGDDPRNRTASRRPVVIAGPGFAK